MNLWRMIKIDPLTMLLGAVIQSQFPMNEVNSVSRDSDKLPYSDGSTLWNNIVNIVAASKRQEQNINMNAMQS